MTTEQQAYINGFVKRAAEYGFNDKEALNILKQAAPQVAAPHANDLGAALTTKAKGPAGPTWSGGIETMPPATRAALRLPAPPPAPKVAPQHMNDLGAATPPTIDQRITRFLGIQNSPTEVPRMNAGSYTGTLGR